MNKLAKITTITVTGAVIGLSAMGAVASWGERGEGCSYKGERHAERAEMRGERHEMRGKRGFFAKRELNLSADQAKTLVEAKLIMRGRENLKVGQVVEKDDDTFLVDLVSNDDSLVRQVEIDKSSGFRHGRGHHFE